MYEVTWYVNADSYDIRRIHPYAAYDLTTNTWAVRPDPLVRAPQDAMWDVLADQDLTLAQTIIASYNKAYGEVEGTVNPGLRLNAEITLRTAAAKGALLFNSIHEGRKLAFGPDGTGYDDFHEFRYKTAKSHGIMSALREMKVELEEAGLLNDQGTYGVELSNARDTLVRAALSRRYQR